MADRLQVQKNTRLDAPPVCKKRKEMQLELDEANQKAEILKAKRDAELAHDDKEFKQKLAHSAEKAKQELEVKRKAADLDVEIIKNKAAMQEDTKERRAQQEQRLIETEARLAALARMFIPLGAQHPTHRIQVQDW